MTILIHNYHQLDERASHSLKVWKGWHITLYLFAAVFGMLNYSFLQSTNQLFDENCALYPRNLQFHTIKLYNATEDKLVQNNKTQANNVSESLRSEELAGGIMETTKDDTDGVTKSTTTMVVGRRKRETVTEPGIVETNLTVKNNSTAVNRTHRVVLYTARSLFATESSCQLPLYMPISSTAFALIWVTLFTICPGGGLTRSGLRQPWRILAPALLFAVVLVVLTGHSFSRTNGGLQALCAAFSNITNTTACSAVDDHVERAWNASWGVSAHVAATRAASAGAWASWACACALLLARCLAAPDFTLRRTDVILKHDPEQKVTPHLKRSPKKRSSQRQVQLMTSKSIKDDASVKSEPTLSSELVTASIEHRGLDSGPTSLTTSPARRHGQRDEMLELVYIPQDLEIK